MPTTVDLRELAIERSETGRPTLAMRQHLLTRYVLPSILLLGFLSLITWAGWDFIFPPKAVTVMPVVVTTGEVQRSGTPLFKAAGWIEPRPTPVRVAALAPGVVEALFVVEDQAVKAGEPVAELVKDDAQLAYESALADQNLRQAELQQAESDLVAATTRYEQPVHLIAVLREAEATQAKLETQYRNLPFELQRAVAEQSAAQANMDAKQAAKDGVAGLQIDFAKSRLDAAKSLVQELTNRDESLRSEKASLAARCEALQRQLELLTDEKKAKEGAVALVKAAEARIEQARVAVAEAKLRLDRMTITAPIDGRVYRLVAEPGTQIGGGSTLVTEYDGSTVITMYRPEKLQVRVDVRFEDVPKIALHQPVEINNPALSSPITGTVLFISSEADIQKNTLQVKVAIPDPPTVFKPEMLVDVTFLAPQSQESDLEPTQVERFYVPTQLIQRGEEGTFVWVADQSEGVARKVNIETNNSDVGPLVEITSGLSITSRLIVSGIDGLKNGQRIRVTGEDVSLGSDTQGQQAGSKRESLHRLPTGDDH